jgi:acyl-CoA thioester hydrolase
VSAEAVSVGGLLDLEKRRLVAQPREFFERLTTDPGLFGI